MAGGAWAGRRGRGGAPAAALPRAAATRWGRMRQGRREPPPQTARAAGRTTAGMAWSTLAKLLQKEGPSEQTGSSADARGLHLASLLRQHMPSGCLPPPCKATPPGVLSQLAPCPHLQQAPGHVKGAVAAAHILGHHAAQLQGGDSRGTSVHERSGPRRGRLLKRHPPPSPAREAAMLGQWQPTTCREVVKACPTVSTRSVRKQACILQPPLPARNVTRHDLPGCGQSRSAARQWPALP